MIKVILFDVGKVLIRFSGPQIRLYRLAAQLKKRGFRLAILSNVIMPVGVVLKRLHVYSGFEPVVLSYEEKIKKPNIEIYKRTVEKLGVRPEEIVFIDNLQSNLVPAQELGMHTIHAKRTTQAVANLKALLKKENNLDV